MKNGKKFTARTLTSEELKILTHGFSPNCVIKFRDGEKQQEYEALLKIRMEEVDLKMRYKINLEIEKKASEVITIKEKIILCNYRIVAINKLLKEYN